MLLFDGFLGVVAFALWVFCIIDVITTPEERIRNLPKLLWLLIVILLFDIGTIAWLIAGRDWNKVPVAATGRSSAARTPARPTNPDDDQEFLDGLRRRAEEQRRRAREATDDDPST